MSVNNLHNLNTDPAKIVPFFKLNSVTKFNNFMINLGFLSLNHLKILIINEL